MDPRCFRFASSFTLPAPREQVAAVLADLEHYVDWWRQVRAVARIDDDHALVVCRSTLPYDLELELTALRRDPALLEVGIDGPIRGWARFRLAADDPGSTAGPGPATRLEFEQQVRAEAPVMVLASYAVKPVLAWNHRRMMAGAEQGLRRLVEEGAQAPSLVEEGALAPVSKPRQPSAASAES